MVGQSLKRPTSDPSLLGALVGWLQFARSSGIILRIQAAKSKAALGAGVYDEFDLILTSNQMRMLGKELIRAADRAEGIDEGLKRRLIDRIARRA